MSNLYQLTEDYLALMDMFDDAETDEQVLLDTLEGIFGEIEIKVENCVKIIKNLQADAAGANEEAQRLSARVKAYEKRADLLKRYVLANMKAANIQKIKTSLFTVSIAKNGGKQPLVITGSIDDIPGRYLIPQDPLPNNEAISRSNGHILNQGVNILESGKKINITPYRSGQLLELAGDLAKRMTASKYGYLTYDENRDRDRHA